MITYQYDVSSKCFVSRCAADVHRSRPPPPALSEHVQPRCLLSPHHLFLALALASLHLLSSSRRSSRCSGDAFGAFGEKSARRAEHNHPSPLLRILHPSHRRQPARPQRSRIDELDAAFRPPRAVVRRDEHRVGARIAAVTDTVRHHRPSARARDAPRRFARRLIAIIRTPRLVSRVASHRRRRHRDDDEEKQQKRDE